MARVASAGWVTGQVTPTRLRLYHILFIIFSGLAAAAIAAPSILTQPVLYTAGAVVQFDRQRFASLLQDGAPAPALNEMQQQLGEVLSDRYEGLGSNRAGLEYHLVAGTQPPRVEVVAYAGSREQTVQLANDAAQGLARRIYAAQGATTLRHILGAELWSSLEGHPISGREQALLRQVILTDAFFGTVKAAKAGLSLESLNAEQRFAVTRALEVQHELVEHNLRSAERALQGGDNQDAAAATTRKAAADQLLAIRLLEMYLYDTYGTVWNDPARPGPAFVPAPAANATVIPTHDLLRLLTAVFVGLIGGFFVVLLDRAVGIATKLAELWAYRELIKNMVVRDLKARYKNSLLGYVWSLLNPLMTMLIFWFVFDVLLRNDIPMFPVFLIVALLPWSFAVTSVSSGMRAILDNSHLVNKVYFPREILPITVVLSNLVNYLLALPVMFLVMAGVQLTTVGHLQFSWYFAFFPVILAIQIIFLIGVSLLLSTMAVFFRDTTHIVDILLQLWIFLTPVFFSLEAVTRGNVLAAKVVRWLNPMASIVDFYRDIFYGQPTNPIPGLPALDGVFRTLLTALVILAVGAYVFHRGSAHFGEEL